MAKNGSGASRFSKILFLALVVSLGITVWSVQKAPTNTEQFAEGLRCGFNNQNPSCPTGYQCIYTNNNPFFGGNCALKTLNAAQNLKAKHFCEYNSDNPNNVVFSFSWSRVQNVTSYKVYGNYYYVNNGNLTNTRVGPYSTSVNSATIYIPIPQDVKYFYWYVKPYNSNFKITGPISSVPTIKLDCR